LQKQQSSHFTSSIDLEYGALNGLTAVGRSFREDSTAILPRLYTAWKGNGRAIAKALKFLAYCETVGDDCPQSESAARLDGHGRTSGGFLHIEPCGAPNGSEEF
jgi:hypothetical protein